MGRSRKYIILNRIWEIFQTAVWVVQGGKLAGILPYFILHKTRKKKLFTTVAYAFIFKSWHSHIKKGTHPQLRNWV